MKRRHQDQATRRNILIAGLAAIGSGVAMQAKGQEKIAQKTVQYQTTPKDGHQCSTCANYIAPSSCKIVEGTIVPTGWCIAWGPKS